MKIGILETGRPPGDLAATYGDYPAMFRALLGPGFDYVTYDVEHGQLPKSVDECDAYVVTGSPAGVYDGLPWIAPLDQFLAAARGRVRLVGICFGHQVMAEAFGGKVTKSDKGWGVGQHTYTITAEQPWMDGAASITIPVSHQDQVVEPPPGATVTAASDFTPYAGLAYGEEAISFQGHPEFARPYAEALVHLRRQRLGEQVADAALDSLKAPNDDARVGGWIREFLIRP